MLQVDSLPPEPPGKPDIPIVPAKASSQVPSKEILILFLCFFDFRTMVCPDETLFLGVPVKVFLSEIGNSVGGLSKGYGLILCRWVLPHPWRNE